MSKTKSRSRPTWLLPAILVGIAAVVVAIIAVISGGRSTPFVPQVSGAPRAEFDQTSIDHGGVRFERAVESIFRVRNVGDQDLVILGEPRVELMQGC
ncbi:MAG: hypothetical protein JNJ61_03380 [Anaerolineae bacterium]|nr:hypothetical protein [Anaerolineae bacterium]